MEGLVVALDQASSTGWAVSDLQGNILNSGTKKFVGTLPGKLVKFHEWLGGLIDEYRPIVIAHEKPHFRGYSATLSGVGFVSCISMQGFSHNVPVIAVHTGTLKKFASGYGKSDKEVMTTAASEIIGSSLSAKEDNDAADAIHIARWAVEAVTRGDIDI